MKFTQWILFASGVTSAMLVSATYQTSVAPQTVQAQPLQLAQTTTDQLPRLPQSSRVDRSTLPVPVDEPVSTTASLGRAPTMTMEVPEGNVSVQIENMTAETLTYQALGDTELRRLAEGDDITLTNLQVPTTVTFSYAEIDRNRLTKSGLTAAKVSSETDGTLHLVVEPTDSLDTEASNLTVESGGRVFVF